MRQFLVPVMPVAGTVIVQGRDYRYLVQVLRLSPGDCFDGRLPDGSLCSLEVRDIRKHDKTVLLAVRDAVSDSTAVCGGNWGVRCYSRCRRAFSFHNRFGPA